MFTLRKSLILLVLFTFTNSSKAQETIEIKDLGISFNLPEGWIEHQKPLRATQADRLNQLPNEFRALGKTDDPGKLEMGANFYSYHNLDDYGSVPEETLFFYSLSIQMHTYKTREERRLWAKGLCGSNQICSKSHPQLKLIRKLEKEENPFDSGAGYLHEIEAEEEGALPRLVFIYYVVKGDKSYEIQFDGLARDLEKEPYPEMLVDMEFVK